MSVPELAAWKKRSDALEQQSNQGAAQENRTLRDEDVEAYLQALEKEVYYTRILIHQSEGRRVKQRCCNGDGRMEKRQSLIKRFAGTLSL